MGVEKVAVKEIVQYLGSLVEDVRNCCEGVPDHSVRHTSNGVAHHLSKEGCKNNLCKI